MQKFISAALRREWVQHLPHPFPARSSHGTEEVLTLPLVSVPLQGGNDYEIYDDPRTVGHSVQSPQDTVQRCREIFFPERANEY